MLLLKERLASLEQKLLSLEAEIFDLRAENIALRAENAALKLENQGLNERLGLNSKNSSIPSSKELYKIRRNEIKKLECGRKQGAQVGHKGAAYERLEADEIIEVAMPESACECGGEFTIANKAYIHQQIDLPPIKPHVVEYRLAHGRCKRCGKRKSSSLPEGVSADKFGLRVKATVAALTGFYKNSKREVEGILKDIFNLKISLGSVSNSEFRVAKKCKVAYEEIEQTLTSSELLHIDETSHYTAGKLGWCWLFSDGVNSIIKLVHSRGKKVLEDSVFGTSDHIVVTDRYAAYNYFLEENRQVCWAHLARDFSRLAHSYNGKIREVGVRLEQVTRELFALKTAMVKNEIDVLYFTRRARKLRKKTWYFLRKVADEESAIGATRIAKNIMKSERMMWKFLEDPTKIPLTNNHAEQQIRHYVVYRKNSYFSQSERGNRFLEIMISLFLTAKAHARNPILDLHNLMIT